MIRIGCESFVQELPGHRMRCTIALRFCSSYCNRLQLLFVYCRYAAPKEVKIFSDVDIKPTKCFVATLQKKLGYYKQALCYTFTNHFNGLGKAIGQVCVSVISADSDLRTN